MNETNWYTESGCSLDAFSSLLERDTAQKLIFASDSRSRIPLYDCGALAEVLRDSSKIMALQAEWATVLRDGRPRCRPLHAA